MTYTPKPHVTQNWVLAKPGAQGTRGMVASQAREAAEAGVAMLDEGGNAVDAAVACAFALTAVEPWNSGLGGIGLAVVHPDSASRAHVVDFGPRAPAALEPSKFRLTGRMRQDLFAWPEVEHDANIHGALSFVIPSAVEGYRTMHERWGKLPLHIVMEPALMLARRGLAQDWYTTLKIAASAAVLRRYPESARIYLPNGLPPVAPYQGVPRFLPLGQLAATLEQLMRAGLRDFYEGDIASALLRDCAAINSVVSATDLRQCEAQIGPATEFSWGPHIVQTTGGLTAGATLARLRARMVDVPHGDMPDAVWYVAFARAMRQAYDERLANLGEGEVPAAQSCTSHITACDAGGSMVAMTTTLLSSMGSRVVLPETGVLMNNGVMWFDPRHGQRNSLAPGRRPLTNMCPVIVREGDVPMLAGGASGGRRILAAVAQSLCYVLDFGMNLAQAAHHPRIDVSGQDLVTADQRLGDAVLTALALDGPLEIVEHTVLPINFACPNLILRHQGLSTGISDIQSPWSAAIAQH